MREPKFQTHTFRNSLKSQTGQTSTSALLPLRRHRRHTQATKTGGTLPVICLQCLRWSWQGVPDFAYFFAVPGIELRASRVIGEYSTMGLYPAPNTQGSNTYALKKNGFHI